MTLQQSIENAQDRSRDSHVFVMYKLLSFWFYLTLLWAMTFSFGFNLQFGLLNGLVLVCNYQNKLGVFGISYG